MNHIHEGSAQRFLHVHISKTIFIKWQMLNFSNCPPWLINSAVISYSVLLAFVGSILVFCFLLVLPRIFCVAFLTALYICDHSSSTKVCWDSVNLAVNSSSNIIVINWLLWVSLCCIFIITKSWFVSASMLLCERKSTTEFACFVCILSLFLRCDPYQRHAYFSPNGDLFSTLAFKSTMIIFCRNWVLCSTPV